MQPLRHFLGVAFVVQLKKAGENFTPGGFADREADALLRLVKAVAEVEVGPAVGGGYGVVHLDVELAELLDVGTGVVGVVEAVVGLSQPFPPGGSDSFTALEVKRRRHFKPCHAFYVGVFFVHPLGYDCIGYRERLKSICNRIFDSSVKARGVCFDPCDMKRRI